jgi:hypothetical protein
MISPFVNAAQQSVIRACSKRIHDWFSIRDLPFQLRRHPRCG